MLLETTFVNDLVRGNPDAVAARDRLIEQGERVAIFALMVYEVGVGLRGRARNKQRALRAIQRGDRGDFLWPR